MLDVPTRDNETEIHIVTDLTRKELDGRGVAQVFRKRWTIEGAFLHLALDLNTEIKTLGYPPAALFGFAVGLVAYNIVSTMKGSIRAEYGQEVATNLSGYTIAQEIRSAYKGMMMALPPEAWEEVGTWSPQQVGDYLRESHAPSHPQQRGPRASGRALVRPQAWTRHLLALGRPAEAYILGGYFELPRHAGRAPVRGPPCGQEPGTCPRCAWGGGGRVRGRVEGAKGQVRMQPTATGFTASFAAGLARVMARQRLRRLRGRGRGPPDLDRKTPLIRLRSLFPDWHSRFFVAPLGIFFIAAALVIAPAPTRGSSPPTRRASRP